MDGLQRQLVRMQADIKATGKRVIVVFEGRDAAGKSRHHRHDARKPEPRVLQQSWHFPKPSDREAASWYFQRYVDWLPAAGEMAMFDRSWYNRAMVEHVFGFCTPDQRAKFFRQLPEFEHMLVDEGITLVSSGSKSGAPNNSAASFAREKDPLKQWKLSPIDIDGLGKWDEYCAASTKRWNGRISTSPPGPCPVRRQEARAHRGHPDGPACRGYTRARTAP